MLLYEEKEPFDSDEHLFELKLDGIRCVAYLGEETCLQNKRFKDVTALYPELEGMCKCAKKRAILDGELVCMKDGKPDFYALQRRSLMADPFRIRLAARGSKVQYCAFDILYYDGEDLTALPLTARKERLLSLIKEGEGLSISRHIEKNGVAFFRLAERENLEGIVAKRKDGRYYIGKRTREWVKIKVMREEDALVVGYQPDENGRVKDLILGRYDGDGSIVCRGKVFLGVSEEERERVAAFAADHTLQRAWFPQYGNAVWLQPLLVGTVRYMQETEAGGMRQPVWKGLKE